jgi:hypothetical protein
VSPPAQTTVSQDVDGNQLMIIIDVGSPATPTLSCAPLTRLQLICTWWGGTRYNLL